jgi:hypothetical protein
VDSVDARTVAWEAKVLTARLACDASLDSEEGLCGALCSASEARRKRIRLICFIF